ncbi:hypothetical protein MEBOL_007331 [Melittangium boletus DSM 14713]|uniref:Uncharacterized protein n=1 Tax=Melittangium boletus DSM 14713 TaxID=1294270 RepID=A0A250IRF6_9BACT|nr:hypothetical protein MEBOL_007331 [Melittangium boletus DSM 14713]
MRPAEIELWARSIIERVQKKQPVEDARVELKSEWLDKFHQIARRVAGHANAARGEPILWLIGLKEGVGVVGVDLVEFASWWRQVSTHFDPPAPTPYELGIPVADEGKTVVAILFETERAPFVVQNPHFNQSRGEIRCEVPWREGTSVRTATRADLLKILVPQQKLPRLEVLWGELSACVDTNWDADRVTWRLEAHVFIEGFEERVAIPRHRCAVSIELNQCQRMPLRNLGLRIDESEEKAGAVVTGNVAHFAMPGVLVVEAVQAQDVKEAEGMGWLGLESARVDLLIRPVGADVHASVQVDMRRTHSQNGGVFWRFGERIHRVDEYEEWVSHIEHVLVYGEGGNTCQIKDSDRKWAARAVREGRLAWMKGVPSMLTLP